MADNKVKFLRGTSNEYAVAEKDSDTIYFTTDDGKLYIGDKEVSGDGSITIDDTLSDTSTNPVQNKAVKQAIDNKANKTTATTDTDGLMSAEDKSKLDSADDTYALKSLYGDTTINVGRKAGTIVGHFSTAEGQATTASSLCSHAEGDQTTASGNFSHSEGEQTKAIGAYSHAEGCGTEANGRASHAEGRETTAFGDYSHTSGYYTKALHENEAAYGKYNKSNEDTLFSIGDGTADDARHNAFEITTNGGKLHDKDIATTDLIPTTLPANGGNADTLDGLHADDFAKSTSPRINGDMVFQNDSNQNTINAIYSANDNLVLRNITKDGTSICDVLIGNDGVRIANATQNFIIGDGGNADTVDGFHADDFAKAYNDYLGTYLAGKSGDIRELAHLLPTGGLLGNTYYPEFQNITFPISGDILITWNKSKFSQNGLIYGTLTIQSMTSTGDICICSVYNTTAYTDWQKIYTDWNKPYVTGIATNVVDGVIHSNTYYSYHGFMPSAVFYIVPGQMTNQHDMIYSAKSFDTEKFTAPSMTDGAGNTLTQIKYIMFK